MWEYGLIALLIVLGFILRLTGTRKSNISFIYYGMPVIKPVPIATKDKNFWHAIYIWLFTTRQWVLVHDWHFKLNNKMYKIPAGFHFDGASIPRFLRVWVSPTGVLLIGGLVHDFGYRTGSLLKSGGSVLKGDQKFMDELFRDISIEVNGFYVLNNLAYYALRLFGFLAWNKHRNSWTHICPAKGKVTLVKDCKECGEKKEWTK